MEDKDIPQPDHHAIRLQRERDEDWEASLRERRHFYHLEGYDEFAQHYKNCVHVFGLSDAYKENTLHICLKAKYPDTYWVLHEASREQKERVLNGEPIDRVRAGF